MRLIALAFLAASAQQGWHHREIAPHPDPPIRDGLWILDAPKGSSTFIKRLSDDGQTAWGDCWSPDDNGKRHDLPAFWRRGQAVQRLPMPNGSESGSVGATSPNAHLAAGRCSTGSDQAVVVWTDRGTATAIRRSGPQDSAEVRPISISDDGTVVCEVLGNSPSWLEFKPATGWQTTSEPPVETPPDFKAYQVPPGWKDPTVSALSPNRRYATGSVELPELKTHRTQAVLWSRTVPLTVVGYPFFKRSDDYGAQGTQVSDDGQTVIGRTFVPSDAPLNGPDWVWRPGKAVLTLASLVQVYGLSGMRPDRGCHVLGMSPDGRFVYGSVDTDAKSISASFVLTVRGATAQPTNSSPPPQ